MRWTCGFRALLWMVLGLTLSACRYRAPESIPVGALFPLSGKMADQGEYARNGALMAVAEVNADGGVGGKALRLVDADSQSTGESGLPAYQTLLHAEHVVATVTMLDDVVGPASKLAGRLQHVLLSGSAPDVFVAKEGDTVFSFDPDSVFEARAAAAYAAQTLHITTAATLAVERHTSVAAAAAFADEFRRLGGRIVSQHIVKWNFDAVAYGEDVAKPMRQLGVSVPPLVFVSGPAKTTALALRTGQQMGWRTQWITGSSFELDGGIAAAGAAADGVIYTALRPLTGDTPRAQAFIEAYRRRFGLPPQWIAASTYDAIHALASAMTATGARSGPELARALRSRTLEGVLGRIDFSTKAFLERPLEFRTVSTGRVKVLVERP